MLGMAKPDVDVVLFGATGITGRLALTYLARRSAQLGTSFVVGARDVDAVHRLAAELGLDPLRVVVADASDPVSLAALAARGRVLVNLVGPYTTRGGAVVAACVEAGTSYLDLTGEPQFVRRMDQRWHAEAERRGAAVVQTSGFEALPADLSVHLARERLAAVGTTIRTADVVVGFRPPKGSSGLSDAVSGGTLQSIAEVFGDPDDPHLSDPAARVYDDRAAAAVRRTSPVVLRPWVSDGVVVGAMVPVAFINPAVIHRTAWLLADGDLLPLRYREGTRMGRVDGLTAPLAVAAGVAQSLSQTAVVTAARLPSGLRRRLASGLAAVLPKSGSGPTGQRVEDWSWTMRTTATGSDGSTVVVQLDADGQPGYATTARMISELALVLAAGEGGGRSGCLTPALAAGTASTGRFAEAGMRFSVGKATSP